MNSFSQILWAGLVVGVVPVNVHVQVHEYFSNIMVFLHVSLRVMVQNLLENSSELLKNILLRLCSLMKLMQLEQKGIHAY